MSWLAFFIVGATLYFLVGLVLLLVTIIRMAREVGKADYANEDLRRGGYDC